MDYQLIKSRDDSFKAVCSYCEENIVLENLTKNGGTLNFTGLTFQSDYLFVCYQNEFPIGFVALAYDSKFGFYVNQIAVKKKLQRNGIGSSLIHLSKQFAEEANVPVTAHVRDYNLASQKTFESCGFEKNNRFSSDSNYFYMYFQKTKGEKHF